MDPDPDRVADQVYVACLGGQRLYRVSLDGRTIEALLVEDYGRFRAIAVAPDGSLWVTISNQDQVGWERGTANRPGGDRILRITP